MSAAVQCQAAVQFLGRTIIWEENILAFHDCWTEGRKRRFHCTNLLYYVLLFCLLSNFSWYLCWRLIVADLIGWSGNWILHWIWRGKPIPNSGSRWKRKLWYCWLCNWQPHWRKGCNQENQWCIWACIWCHTDSERNQAPTVASSSGYCWN